MKEQLLKLECFSSDWWMPCKSCLLPHWSNCLAELSWEAELSRLVLLMLIPLISDVVFSWGEALSKSLQTSSSVREVDSESRAPSDETLARSEFWSWGKKFPWENKKKAKIFPLKSDRLLCPSKFQAWPPHLGGSQTCVQNCYKTRQVQL